MDQTCPDCEGSGSFDLLEDIQCKRCGGTGTVPRPNGLAIKAAQSEVALQTATR